MGGARIAREFGHGGRKGGNLLVVSSPMRRCLQTMVPAIRRLGLDSDHCLCHGGAFEFGCAGLDYMGSTPGDITYEFPQFRPVGVGAGGAWDYQGCNAKEIEEESRARGARLAEWLRVDAATAL